MEKNVFFSSAFFLISTLVTLIHSSNATSFKEYEDLCFKYDKSCLEMTDDFIRELYKTKADILTVDSVRIKSYSLNRSQVGKVFNFKGEFSYYGIESEKSVPDFVAGYKWFIIASYLNNANANYKLYLGFKFGFLQRAFKSGLKQILSDKFISRIMTTNYWDNYAFLLDEKISEENRRTLSNLIAHNFLYSSSVKKYKPAMLNLGNKILYGVDMEKNCRAATNYFKYLAADVKEIVSNITRMPSYFKLFDVQEYEAHSFMYDGRKKVSTMEELILYFNMEKDIKKQSLIIPEIASRYLYGLTTEQNVKKAKEWLELGISRQIPICFSLYGELFLYGAAVKRDYKEAFHYLNLGLKKGELVISNNGLGFLYYNGLHVRQNKTQAYINFYNSIKNFANNGTLDGLKSYYNMISVILGQGLDFVEKINKIVDQTKNLTASNATNLTINNSSIKDDFKAAPNTATDIEIPSDLIPTDLEIVYSHAIFLTSYKNVLGTYVFAMMNEYNINADTNNCEFNIMFFKQIANRQKISSTRMKQMETYYFSKRLETSFLFGFELALEGFDFALSNVITLLLNKQIFKSDLRDSLLNYLIEFSNKSNENNVFTLYNSANFHYQNNNYQQAKMYYKNLINTAGGKITGELTKDIIKENNFYMAHGYFSLGMMSYFGWGMQQNEKKALYFFDKALKKEELAYYPITIIKIISFVRKFLTGNDVGVRNNMKNFRVFALVKRGIKRIFNGRLIMLIMTIFIGFYTWFYFNLKKQDEDII